MSQQTPTAALPADIRTAALRRLPGGALSPQLDHVPAIPVQPTGQCDQGSCPAFVQVSIQTREGPAGLLRASLRHELRRALLAGCDGITFERTNHAI